MYFMLATSLSVMGSTLVLKLHYMGIETVAPRWLRVLAFDLLAPALCLTSLSRWSRTPLGCNHNSPVGRLPALLIDGPAHNNACNKTSLSRTLSRTLSLELSLQADDVCGVCRHKFEKEQWQKISQVFDRLFFWMFLLFLIIPIVSLLGFARVFS